MINYIMPKTYFHNSIPVIENVDKIRSSQPQEKSKKRIVDINKLLNRVKINQRNETKRKIIFLSLLTLGLIFVGTFITIIK